jgi:hypothetical protein
LTKLPSSSRESLHEKAAPKVAASVIDLDERLSAPFAFVVGHLSPFGVSGHAASVGGPFVAAVAAAQQCSD